ncbi:PREDICTED: tumor necrosis factor ligand superfamily member 15-like isoform X2 [Acropora digitifera]|uniref:tumor necrosis factor ligand superfamily member 15-like isoform X2 n=1 Tax=Acropora digitifera TaxID=70779 RepID=UPI00077A854F|nr:PREDICTED: tumor necrosis factor ligand superfamily member 15-like isoform X2 [Acropora digitifera]
MRFLLVAITLVCANLHFSCLGSKTSGNQNTCTTPNSPININIQAKGEKGDKGDTGETGEKGESTPCHCALQNASKPSAHLEPLDLRAKTYAANQVIQDWSLESRFSHLAGGMKYSNGRVTVPIAGRYYIYTQIYFLEKAARILVMVNNEAVTMVHPMIQKEGSMFAAGVFTLNAGDVVMLQVNSAHSAAVYMSMAHCYFGTYLI